MFRWLRSTREPGNHRRELNKALTEHGRVMAVSEAALAEAKSAIRESKIARAYGRTPKCFISYPFGDAETEKGVGTLRRFLELIRIDVYAGKGFEPRSVSEKVLDRIAQSDILAVVLTSAGQSEWLRDELTTAGAKGKYIIILVEEGQKFEPGIHGDVEYVPFAKGHIEQTFISLMEAVRYIRRQWEEAERARLDEEDAASLTGQE